MFVFNVVFTQALSDLCTNIRNLYIVLFTHIQKRVGATISTTTTTKFNPTEVFLRENDRFLFGELFFQRSAATGMVDRICQGDDDAALDRKQQAAEVLGDGMGWYGDGG